MNFKVLNFKVKTYMDKLQTCKIVTGYFAAIASCIFCSATNTRTAFSVQVQNKFNKM